MADVNDDTDDQVSDHLCPCLYIYQQAVFAYTSFPEQEPSLIFTKLRETRIEVCNMYLFPLYTLLTTCTRMHTLC